MVPVVLACFKACEHSPMQDLHTVVFNYNYNFTGIFPWSACQPRLKVRQTLKLLVNYRSARIEARFSVLLDGRGLSITWLR
jgi:hypothetical protein